MDSGKSPTGSKVNQYNLFGKQFGDTPIIEPFLYLHLPPKDIQFNPLIPFLEMQPKEISKTKIQNRGKVFESTDSVSELHVGGTMKRKPTPTFQKLRVFFYFFIFGPQLLQLENRIEASSLLQGASHINRALWSSVANVQMEVCTNTMCTEMLMPALFIIVGS